MFFFKLRRLFAVLLFCHFFFLFAASAHRLKIFFVKVTVQISLRITDQLCDSLPVLFLDRFRLCQLCRIRCERSFPLRFCEGAVSFHCVHVVLQRDNLIRPVRPQAVNLRLDLSHILIDRPAQLSLLFLRQNSTVYICHNLPSPSL